MVSKRAAMCKNLLRTIRNSLTRYLAIVLIIALGAGLVVGLLATEADILLTGQQYLDQQNFYDLRVLNPFGWDEDQIRHAQVLPGVEAAEGVFYLDVIGTTGSKDAFSALGSGEDEGVYQLYAIPQQLDMPCLQGGRMPQAPNECLADGQFADENILGKQFQISDTNSQQTLEQLHYQTFTIVGYVSSPLFLDMTRGGTTLGNGSISSYFYIPREAFDIQAYPELHLTLPGEYENYSAPYDAFLDAEAQRLEPMLLELTAQRYAQLEQTLRESLQEGRAEYEQGLADYEQAQQTVWQELEDAYEQLMQAQTQLDEARQQLEEGRKLLDQGQKELVQGQKQLQQAAAQLADAQAQIEPLQDMYNLLEKRLTQRREELEQANLQLEAANENLEAFDRELEQNRGQLQQTNYQITRLQSRITTLQLQIRLNRELLESNWLSDELRQQLQQLLTEQNAALEQAQQDLPAAQQTAAQLEARIDQLEQLRQDLVLEKTLAQAGVTTAETAISAASASLASLDELLGPALQQLEDGRRQLQEGKAEMASAQRLLQQKEAEYQQGLSEFEEGSRELESGWLEYQDGKVWAYVELAKARALLEEGLQQLQDGEKTLAQLEDPQVYVLDRRTNVGYLALQSNADILAGVSRVFPVFFLLVAALVCITTMTRMVEEERTQIGTLKALGYSNSAIIGKYLIYAASASVLGCGIGVCVATYLFPKILWSAYRLILNLREELILALNVPLCLTITLAYTLVVCLVTWYCCHRELREVPAELIRPKPPTSGRKILLERLWFWEKLKFLNKVMWRNIFRYRQRLLMMLVGIGGCTALLITGFGIGDSIKDIVSMQFEDVTLYDIQTQFTQGQTEKQQQTFENMLAQDASKVVFAHQSSVEVEFNNITKSIFLVSPDRDLTDTFDFHIDGQPVAMPGRGEALLSTGTAEALGVSVGDVLTVRNTDMQPAQVRISGVFENYVYNYLILQPDTFADAWGDQPEYQMAFITLAPGTDAHQLSASIGGWQDIMSVMVNQDLANQVGSMLEAMNMIVVTVVVCAALLAVTVVYNLTNINITERLREIATIKVLGFTGWETAAYVFKENLILSVMGTVLGLLGGKFLLQFVMSQIRIDMVWFRAVLQPASWVWSVVLTLLTAIVVDLILYRKLDKIDMAQALKPVE